MRRRFKDRAEAGKYLASRLETYRDRPDTIVLALPRGGVPVGYEVARALRAPLDVYVVRKLGCPGQPELALGAIAAGGALVVNQEVVRKLEIPQAVIAEAVARERLELDRRERLYRGERPGLDVEDKLVVLVDDGLATGASMKAAVASLQARGPARLVIAAPVAAYGTREEMVRTGLEVICGRTPEPFVAVGFWYEQFEQTTDAEVIELLARAATEKSKGPGPDRHGLFGNAG